MLRFLLGWSAWELTGSSTWVGVVAALMLGPAFLLAPYFGVLSDRVNPRHGLMVSMLVHGVISLAGAIADVAGVYSLTTLLVLAGAMGAVTSLHSPMRLALIPVLVSREALPNAVGLSAMTFNVARILGPALGAWLISRAGIDVAWLVTVAMFMVSLLLLASLRGVGAREARSREPLLAQFMGGLRYLAGHRGIQLVFAFTVVNGLMGRTVIEMLPAVSGRLLGGDSTDLAALTAAAGVGSIAGGLLVSRQSANSARLLLLVAAGITSATLLLASVSMFEGLWSLAVMVGLVSLMTTTAGTGCQTLTQLSVAEDYRGRVMSLWTLLAMGSPALGSAVIGVLADYLGFATVLPVTAGAGLLVTLLLYARRRWLLAT